MNRTLSVRLGAGATAIVAFGSAILSWDALSWGAGQLGVDPRLTFLYPLTIDGVICMATIAAVALRRTDLRIRAYVWLLLIGAIGASVVGNATHAAGGNWLHVVGAAVPAVALAASLHLLVILVRHAPGAVTARPTATRADAEPEPRAQRARSTRTPKRALTGARHDQVRALLAEPGGRELTGEAIGARLGVTAGRARHLRAEVERADAEMGRRPHLVDAAPPAGAEVAEEA